MRLTEIDYDNARPIDGYGPGFFRVGGEIHEGATIVTANDAWAWQPAEDVAPLLDLAGKVDVLLLGTGAEMRPVPEAMRSALEEAGIGVEPMATPTACRSWNVLVSEGRRVAAALLPI